MDRKLIVATFERVEKEAGGLQNTVPGETLKKTAEELGLPRELVRSVMLDHWTMGGAG